MSNSKNYNSIVFLTTLSVYLGLVLVGAPPILAHAAMTRHFDIQNEIEVKDDLDKKPKNDNELNQDIELIKKLEIAKAINIFLDDLKKLESISKFNSKTEWNFSCKFWLEEYGTTQTSSKNCNVSNPWLETAVVQLILAAKPFDVYSISEYLPNCNGESCRETSINVDSNANEFSLTFSFKKSTSQKAKIVAEAFNKVFITQKVALKNSVNLPIYENTKATSENNQVLIVTRLPRGSLDALLARKDAQ